MSTTLLEILADQLGQLIQRRRGGAQDGPLGVPDYVREVSSDGTIGHGDGCVVALQRLGHGLLVLALIKFGRLKAHTEGTQPARCYQLDRAATIEESSPPLR